MRQLDGTGLKRLHRAWRQRTRGRLALILDGLGTPANVGAIVRTAAAYRAERLWLAGATPPLSAPGVAKTALGTDRYVSWEALPTGVDAIAAAHEDGFAVVAVELCDEAVPLHELDLPDAVCLAVGHEDHGLARATLEACDHVAFLPMVGRVGSLNVATAAAVAIYEVRRRSWSPRSGAR
jgi:tRNA (guanosine-2'-O-)-methyltransferase